MELEKGVKMFDVYLNFDILRNYEGRVLSSTRQPQFNPKETPW
jgi:hypothetical protein